MMIIWKATAEYVHEKLLSGKVFISFRISTSKILAPLVSELTRISQNSRKILLLQTTLKALTSREWSASTFTK
jgi:hypothetical protein